MAAMAIVAIPEFGNRGANGFHVLEETAVDRLLIQSTVEALGYA